MTDSSVCLFFYKYDLDPSFFFFDNIRLMSVLGIPSQKPKEQQRSVLRPAVLQAPPSKSHLETSKQLCVSK